MHYKHRIWVRMITVEGPEEWVAETAKRSLVEGTTTMANGGRITSVTLASTGVPKAGPQTFDNHMAAQANKPAGDV